MAGSSSPSDNYAQVNFAKVISGKPYHNNGGAEILASPGANSPITYGATSAIFGSVDKKAVTVPSPLTSGYNKVAFVTNSGQPFAQTRKNVYFLDRYSTLIGNTTTTVMQSPSRSATGRQSIYGTTSAVNEAYMYGSGAGFNYMTGQWLRSVTLASGYQMVSVSGVAPVDQNLHMTRQSQGNVVFTVGKTAIHQAYLGRSE